MKFSKTTLIFALASKYQLDKFSINDGEFHLWFSKSILVKSFLNQLGYSFNNLSLLIQALTHQSFLNENPSLKQSNYQRLEFLGDSLLNFYISSNLFNKTLENLTKEGELSKSRAILVNENYFGNIAKCLKLNEIVLVGKGMLDEKCFRNSLACDLFEALIGAIYIDSDYLTCEKVLMNIFKDGDFLIDTNDFDYKTQLQEWSIQNLKQLPKYDFTVNDDLSFTGELFLNNQLIYQVNESSKRKAEERLAHHFFNNKDEYNDLYFKNLNIDNKNNFKNVEVQNVN